MPALHAHNISYHFANGETLFERISCSLHARKTGLVGRNGTGKSILGSILIGDLTPTIGSVTTDATIASYKQLQSELIEGELSIAEFLKVNETLEAISMIESGEYDPKWFDIIGDDWDIEARLHEELNRQGLPKDLDLQCKYLSGGELSRLQLWVLFNKNPDILLLDEPSNHLDTKGKAWLKEKINHFEGKVLLISHDRELLRQMEQIWELSSLGLTQYGGNFDFFTKQKSLQTVAVEKQLKNITNQQAQLERQAQRNREKAQQRQSQGNKIRARGGQPKILLNAMRSGAESSAATRVKNENSRRDLLSQEKQNLATRHEELKAQKLHLDSITQVNKCLIQISEGRLPFGTTEPINLTLDSKSKLHLSGQNGSGKSTLLNVLLGKQKLRSGEVRLNTSVYYLDQHFSLLIPNKTLLQNLIVLCTGMRQEDARTLLAGIGFRRESVYRKANELSGGEKMKLAVLIVSHQPEQSLLLLDEPDNHLDLDSKLLLASVLKSYRGAFILISHDIEFVADAGVTHTLQLSNA
ncbi:ABC-type transport system, ATPase component [Vibrio ishigakensis]|uniref:ABC-type transport system, ATPase component n=1 Tax=Vibrio ishigakensis TaxID=1481914 RepID=A0A0B8P614_9VIBR|nr:ATP-binding cassette domain-containing protein [Vibrio ishigakensis]GAM58369.1 ABC-type transport system, ATPase component [Vibrio ishigakensis]